MESELGLFAAAILIGIGFLAPGAAMALALCMPMIHPGIGEGASWLGAATPGIVLGVALVRTIVRRGNQDQSAISFVDLAILLLIAYLPISIIVSEDKDLTMSSTIRIGYMALSFYITTRLLCYSQGVSKFCTSFMYGFVIFAVFITAFALHLDQSESQFITRLTIGKTYIALANYITVGLLCALYILFFMRGIAPPVIRLIAMCSTPFLFYGMLLCNTRGVVVALGLAILFLTVKAAMSNRLDGSVVRRGIFGMSLAVVAGVAAAIAFPQTWTRMARQFAKMGGEGSESDIQRLELFNNAMNMFLENPIWGEGAGAFEAINRTYPHNLLLETMADMGLIGAAITIILVLGAFLVSIRYQSVNAMFVSALLVLQIFESQVSLAFWMNKNLFVFLGMATALHLLHFGLLDNANNELRKIRTRKRIRGSRKGTLSI